VRGEPRPEVGAELAREGRRASACGGVEVGDGLEEHIAEQMGERGPPAVDEELGGSGVAEDARLLLGEDAITRERAQEAVEDVGVDPGLARELVHRPRPFRERSRDLEVDHDRERLRRHRSAKDVPHQRLGSVLAHARVPWTTAATSSASATSRRDRISAVSTAARQRRNRRHECP
jgi:hypothetical protein